MAAELHSPTPEELMEYLDGEGTSASRAAIDAHLAGCAACQALADEHRVLSRDIAAWQVPTAPDTLRAPAAQPVAPRRWRPTRVVLAGLSTAAAVLIFAGYQVEIAPLREATKTVVLDGGVLQTTPTTRIPGGGGGARPIDAYSNGPGRVIASPVPPPPQPGMPAPEPPLAPAAEEKAAPAQGRALIRTATMQIVAKDFNDIRAGVERIVGDVSGFADQMSVSADPGSARVLRATLRVPGDRLNDTLARLRALGQVTEDQQNAQDVADQLVDLDARLKNARATEQRLTDILRERTGKLTDVLQVEREVARVRLEIEQLDAQKANMSRRVAYAAVDLTISEERKAGLDSGPLPLLTEIRIAAADGVQSVVDTLVGLMLFVLRAGPAVALWGMAGLVGWVAVKRIRHYLRTT